MALLPVQTHLAEEEQLLPGDVELYRRAGDNEWGALLLLQHTHTPSHGRQGESSINGTVFSRKINSGSSLITAEFSNKSSVKIERTTTRKYTIILLLISQERQRSSVMFKIRGSHK